MNQEFATQKSVAHVENQLPLRRAYQAPQLHQLISDETEGSKGGGTEGSPGFGS